MMVQGGSRDSLPCEGVSHSILGIDGVVDEDLLIRMLSRNGVNIAGTKAFDYLLSKLRGPEDLDANEDLDIQSLADLEFLKDTNKRKDFQNSIENLLKDFGDLDSSERGRDLEEASNFHSQSRTHLSRRPSVHPSRDTQPSIPSRSPEVEPKEEGKPPHSHLLKILEGVVKDVQNDGGRTSTEMKKRASSRPKQRKSRGEEDERDRDRASRMRKKSVGRASERTVPSDESRSVKSKGADKSRGESALPRSSHKRSGTLDGSTRKERSSAHRNADPDMGRKSGHSSKQHTGCAIRRESDSQSNHHHSPMESRKKSSSSHRNSSQHSLSSRSSSKHDPSHRSHVRNEAPSWGNNNAHISITGQMYGAETYLKTPVAKAKVRASLQPTSPETAVTYEFDQEESESSFACSSFRSSPAQGRGRRASSPVSRRGRSRSTSRAMMKSRSRVATTQPDGSWISPSGSGHDAFTSHDFEMREGFVSPNARTSRRCRSVEPSMWRSSLSNSACGEESAEFLSYPGRFEAPTSVPARRRSSIGSTHSCSTPAQRRRSMGSSSVVSLPHGFTSVPHRRGSIDSTSMGSVQHAPHHLPFPSSAHRRNSMDSLSISSMPHLYGPVAPRRSSLNGGVIRSPSSLSVSSRVSNVSGVTAQSAPAHLYRSPAGWGSPTGPHHSPVVNQAYPSIRPPPQTYLGSRRGSSSGGGYGAGEARRRARSDPAADPFFSVSAFGHSSTDPFRAARRASLY